jgi:hypothetical protein
MIPERNHRSKVMKGKGGDMIVEIAAQSIWNFKATRIHNSGALRPPLVRLSIHYHARLRP